MAAPALTARDLEQIWHLGIATEEVERQLELFAHPPPPLHLDRPARVGDGILRLDDGERRHLAAAADEAMLAGRFAKFVPASGAATRMFRSLLKVLSGMESHEAEAAELAALAERGDEAAAHALEVMEKLERFAFFSELAASMRRAGLDPLACREGGDLAPILRHLLTPTGLHYAELPKGLIAFHRYAEGTRTAFDEHLVEAEGHVRDRGGACRLHFTVPPDHHDHFVERLDRTARQLAPEGDTRFEVTFSSQARSTDTLAVDLDNQPFRHEDGSLLFRPGGHGALLTNLHRFGQGPGDLVFIKNIDNVVPDRLKPTVLEWKKVLGGLLVVTQREVFRHLERLGGDGDGAVEIEEAAAFVAQRLGRAMPAGLGAEEARSWLVDRLDRPLRVCGMVANEGEPGGGPFWVRGPQGEVTLQIVETSQIDKGSAEQRQILSRATHFNPVDLACGLWDRHGEPYDLHRFVDESTAFISRKSLHGRPLKALERPGLWNGGMAGWNTLFVEVPVETFAPVKTVLDLLRPQHQAAG